MHKKNKMKERFLWALMFSLFLHIMCMFWQVDWNSRLKELNEKRNSIRVALLTEKEKEKLLEELRKKKEVSKKQIVDNEDLVETKNTPKKEDTRFLSKTNQNFDRQTMAKEIGAFKKSGFGFKNGKDIVAENKSAEKSALKRSLSRTGKQKLSLDNLGLSVTENARNLASLNPREIQKGVSTGDKKVKGSARSSDFIEDIPMGDMTHLNTVEFKYFSFYERIKRSLEQYWGQSLHEVVKELYRQGRYKPNSGHKITSLRVKIDPEGNIVNVIVQDTSGMAELDNVAVESFNKAGPFPNPPQGMIQNGYAVIEWGFVLRG